MSDIIREFTENPIHSEIAYTWNYSEPLLDIDSTLHKINNIAKEEHSDKEYSDEEYSKEECSDDESSDDWCSDDEISDNEDIFNNKPNTFLFLYTTSHIKKNL